MMTMAMILHTVIWQNIKQRFTACFQNVSLCYDLYSITKEKEIWKVYA